MKTSLLFPLLVSGGTESSLLDQDDSPVPAQALEIVAGQKGVFTQPPRIVPTRKVPDGPLLGNGDLGVTLEGVIERQIVYELDQGEDYDLGARHYHDLLQIGIEKGVKPSMEFLGFVEQLSTIEDALEIMNKSGHPQATMILDPFHVFRGGGSIESIARLREGQIAISHFNDAPASPPREQQHDPDRVMPGDGHLDLKSYLQLLNDIGYRRYLSLELFREELWVQDPLDVARTGLEKMRAVVEG